MNKMEEKFLNCAIIKMVVNNIEEFDNQASVSSLVFEMARKYKWEKEEREAIYNSILNGLEQASRENGEFFEEDTENIFSFGYAEKLGLYWYNNNVETAWSFEKYDWYETEKAQLEG